MLMSILALGLPEWRLQQQDCPTCPGGQFFAGHQGDATGYGGISPTEKTIPCGQVDHSSAFYLKSNPQDCFHRQDHHSSYEFDGTRYPTRDLHPTC
mmetsp:Transcript_37602/g.58713  ORF Transcript_37602/g.58713 Transcript_37602/m.58713 type:complete len:96 (-) Transcript_37602:145-432(-)